MPTVRELTTKFSFQVDQRGVRRFGTAMSGMERRIAKVGAVLGVGLGVKKLADIGFRLDRAANQAKRFGAVLGENNKFVGLLGSSLDAMRDQFGAFDDAIPLEQFVNFQRLVKGFPNIGVGFEEFFRTGVVIAKAGQRDMDEVFGELVQSLETGSTAILQKLPGIGARTRARIEKIFGITGPGFFLKPEQRPQFFNVIFGELRRLDPELTKSAEKIRKTASGQATEFVSSFETAAARLGNSLVKLLTKPLQLLNELLDLLNDENPELPVLAKVAEFLGVIPKGAKLGVEEVKKLKALAKDMAIGMAAGIGTGLVLGLPPILGAVLGLGGGALLNKLKEDISKQPEPYVDPETGRLTFPPPRSKTRPEQERIISRLSAADDIEEDFDEAPVEGSPTSFLESRAPGSVSVVINIRGDDTRTIGRVVVEEIERVVGRASREFQVIEGVS